MSFTSYLAKVGRIKYPGSDLDLLTDPARQISGMIRLCSTQTAHEKTLSGPNRSTGLWLNPCFFCWTLTRPKIDAIIWLDLKCSRWTQQIYIPAENWLMLIT